MRSVSEVMAHHSIDYPGKCPQGLIGNGHANYIVGPLNYHRCHGPAAQGAWKLSCGEREIGWNDSQAEASFLPGSVLYTLRVDGSSIRILHCSAHQSAYCMVIESDLPNLSVQHTTEGRGAQRELQCFRHSGTANPFEYYSLSKLEGDTSIDALRRSRCNDYMEGLQLNCPSTKLSRAIPYCKQLLELSNDGNLMRCELFRYQDVWARDLASGLLPGSLYTGIAGTGRTALDYDLGRYAANAPEALKNQDDCSKGGSIDGVCWTARSIWMDYQFTGDFGFLEKSATILRPWIQQWLLRDYDEDGIVIDITEHLDHLAIYLTTDGCATLAANALFAGMCRSFARIESELGNHAFAEELEARYAHTVQAINERYWLEEEGWYANLLINGDLDRRINQTYHGLLFLADAVPEARARRSLEALRSHNWNDYGSATFTPPAKHVGLDNDQNVKNWPWWNMWEAYGRFCFSDAEGGHWLLERAAETLERDSFPGLMEENMDTDGTLWGGHAFATGAGSFIDTVVTGLLGFEIINAGGKRVRVDPKVPEDWKNYSARIPLREGYITLQCVDGQLTVMSKSPLVEVIEVSSGSLVEGASRASIPQAPNPRESLPPIAPKKVPDPKAKQAVFLRQNGLPQPHSFNSRYPSLDAAHLPDILERGYQALIIPGNSMPRYCGPDRKPTEELLERFLEQGGSVVFMGASTNRRIDAEGLGQLLEQGGIIDWYDTFHGRQSIALDQWRVAPSEGEFDAVGPNNPGYLAGWHRPDYNDEAWAHVDLTQFDLRATYPGCSSAWYRCSFALPKAFEGEPILIELGPVEDKEWLYMNGQAIGDYRSQTPQLSTQIECYDMPDDFNYRHVSRLHRIMPDSPCYSALRFGEHNCLAIHVTNFIWAPHGGGIRPQVAPTLGIERGDARSWLALDLDRPGIGFSRPRRKGCNYWGREHFRNCWDSSHGMIGFQVHGHHLSADHNSPLGALTAKQQATPQVVDVYTDFVTFAPWHFQPLAYISTQKQLLHPDTGERYPCAARLFNHNNCGEILLISPAAIQAYGADNILNALRFK